MSNITINGSVLGNSLSQFLTAEEIQPGDEPSYQVCKTIYVYHPLGGKMAAYPVRLAMSQAREISIPASPEEKVRDAFEAEWAAIGADEAIFNCTVLSRVYGVASIAVLAEGVPSDRPIDPKALYDLKLSFNVLDPLNTAGSLVLSQNPNSLDFQKHTSIAVSGQAYHRSRTVTLMHEQSVYIQYTQSAFGYVGRSVYQRALYPLKSFVSTMITDDMVSRKAGLLVAMMKQAGSIVDNIMATMAGVKRAILKEAATDNVISIGETEKVESINLQNLEGPHAMARKHILENIASSGDMPAKLLTEESLSSSLNEGTEESKRVAQYVDDLRKNMKPLYDFFDPIVQRRAWNPEFYKTIQEQFPEEYGKKTYTQAFYEWSNSFNAAWPSFLREPDSEKIKVEQTKLEALIAAGQVLMPELDPENKATVIAWIQDNFNENKMLFSNPLELDFEALKNYEPPEQQAMGGEEGAEGEPAPPKPFKAIGDSQGSSLYQIKRLPRRL